MSKKKRDILQEQLDIAHEKWDKIPDWVFFPLPAFVFGGLLTAWLIREKAITPDSVYRLLNALNTPVIWLGIGLWIVDMLVRKKSKDYVPAEDKVVRPRDEVKTLRKKLRLAERDLAVFKSSSSAQNKLLTKCLKELGKSYESS